MNIPDKMNVWELWLEYTTLPAIYEALAEECSELAQVALKSARAIRGENPTPVKLVDLTSRLEEELTDVINCAIALCLDVNDEQSVEKFERMKTRFYEFYDTLKGNGNGNC